MQQFRLATPNTDPDDKKVVPQIAAMVCSKCGRTCKACNVAVVLQHDRYCRDCIKTFTPEWFDELVGGK